MNFSGQIAEISHKLLKGKIKEGDVVVDATVGNGFDTLFLATEVGKKGKVYGFDIQKMAIASTEALLDEYDMRERVMLHLDGHENLDQYVVEEVQAIMFNLGYLPKGDKRMVTKFDTTIQAIEKGLERLKKRGTMILTVYYGHEGGSEEKEEVEHYVKTLSPKVYNVVKIDFFNRPNQAPYLLVIEKK